MTVLSSLITRARIVTRTQSTRSNLVSDADFIEFANMALEDARKKMIEVESNLIYNITSLNTVDGTKEYDLPSGIVAPFVAPVILASVHGLVPDGVWIDGEDWYLAEAKEEDKIKYDVDTESSRNQPTKYYLTSDFKIGFLPTPNDAYTVYLTYWKTVAALDSTSDTLPWKDIWNRYVEKYMEYMVFKIYERDTTATLAELAVIEDEAMVNVYQYGVRHRLIKSDFFSVDGI